MKKWMKFLIAILCNVAIVLSSCVIVRTTVSAETFDDFSYQVIEDGTAIEITQYVGTSAVVTVPDLIEELPVTSVGYTSFTNNQVVTNVFLPDSIKRIGLNAFAGCGSLRSINYPDALEIIEDACQATGGEIS